MTVESKIALLLQFLARVVRKECNLLPPQTSTCLEACLSEGFAHGYMVLSDTAQSLCKTIGYWVPEFERSIAWNDPAIGIQWPIQGEPSLFAQD